MQTPHYHTQPLGICRPHPCPKQTEHVLTVALHGDDGSLWEAVLNLDMRPAAARKLLVFELPAPAQADGAAIRPVSGGQTKFTVRLAGAASRPIKHDWSDLPDTQWEAAIAATFARCPATLVVVAASFRICVALHAGATRNPTPWRFESVRCWAPPVCTQMAYDCQKNESSQFDSLQNGGPARGAICDGKITAALAFAIST